ncbi:MAG: helix-turn-helix transcriptional regulator [Oscillospiraceae bacterium]|nr:helix-turn-helix transcriptional regulator [Oscillospiraceae bacterium]
MQKGIVDFNVRLTEKMAERGITQADLCRLTGLASSMVSHYCTGQRMPSVPAALKIASVLNTSVDYLAYGSQRKSQKTSDGAPAVSEKGEAYNLRQSRMKRLEDEQSLIQLFQSLGKEGKSKVFDYMEDLISTGKY